MLLQEWSLVYAVYNVFCLNVLTAILTYTVETALACCQGNFAHMMPI